MKNLKLFSLMLLAITFTVFAQKPTIQNQGFTKYQRPIKTPTFNALKVKLNPIETKRISTEISSFDVYALPINDLNEYIDNNPYSIVFDLVLGERPYKITLQRNDLRSPEYVRAISGGEEIVYEKREIATEHYTDVRTFKGFVNDKPENIFRGTISNEIFTGYMYDSETGDWIMFETVCALTRKLRNNTNIGLFNGNTKAKSKPNISKPIIKPEVENTTDCNQVIFYNLGDSNAIIACEVDDITNYDETIVVPEPTDPTAPQCSPFILEIATDADYEYYENKGFDIDLATLEILTAFNLMEGIYSANFNTIISITFQHFNTSGLTEDPYSTTAGPSDIVNSAFRGFWFNNFSIVNRDLAIMFYGRNLEINNNPVYGRIAGISSTPGENGYNSICQYPDWTYAIVKDYYQTYITLTHEVTHLFGAKHLDPQIDCAYNVAPYNEPINPIMCRGYSPPNPRALVPHEKTRNTVIDHLSNFNSCLDGNTTIAVSSDWMKTWSNDRNGQWIGTWHLDPSDKRVIGDFTGTGDDEIWAVAQNNGWATLLDYDCGVDFDWRHEWSNMGNGLIHGWILSADDRYFAADFDGDGKDELFTVSPNNVWAAALSYNYEKNLVDLLWKNNGTGTVGWWTIGSDNEFVFGDFTDDGSDEILMIDNASGWAMLLDFNSITYTFEVLWDNNGDGFLHPEYALDSNTKILTGNFTNTNSPDELYFINYQIIAGFLIFNNSLNQWVEYIQDGWSQTYGWLNSSNTLIYGNYDNDLNLEIFFERYNRCRTADFDFEDPPLNQNWYSNVGYVIDAFENFYANWELHDDNTYETVKPFVGLPDQILSTRTNSTGNYTRAVVLKANQNYNYKTLPDKDTEALILDGNFNVYPNPFTEHLTLQSQFKLGKVLIYDINGNIVLKQNVNKGKNDFNTELLPNGVYLLNLRFDDEIVSFKIVKQ